MVKPKFALFQMKIKAVLLQTSKFDQACFGIGPKTFYPIDVRVLIGKFIRAMFHTKMFLITEIYQTIISTPAIRMDDAFQRNTSSYNALKSAFGAIRDYFGVNTAIAFEEAKNNGFAAGAPAS